MGEMGKAGWCMGLGAWGVRRWIWPTQLWGRLISGGKAGVGSGMFLSTWAGFVDTDGVIGMSQQVLLFYWKLEGWSLRPIHLRTLIRRLLRMFDWGLGFIWPFGRFDHSQERAQKDTNYHRPAGPSKTETGRQTQERTVREVWRRVQELEYTRPGA